MTGSTKPEINEPWLHRKHVLGRSQARYLWVLFVAVIFYWALHAQVLANPDLVVTAPVIGLDVSARIVWATAPITIGTVILIIWGALRSYDRSREKAGVAESPDAEAYDLSPNAIDLAVYTTPKSPQWLGRLLYFSYPAVLAVALAEGIVIFVRLLGVASEITGGWVLAAVGFVTSATAAVAVLRFFRARVQKVWGEIRQPRSRH